VVDADSAERLWNLTWVTAEGDPSGNSSVRSIGWLDSGRYLLEFRKYGALSRSDANTRIGNYRVSSQSESDR
jgi:hypothetical protein